MWKVPLVCWLSCIRAQFGRVTDSRLQKSSQVQYSTRVRKICLCCSGKDRGYHDSFSLSRQLWCSDVTPSGASFRVQKKRKREKGGTPRWQEEMNGGGKKKRRTRKRRKKTRCFCSNVC